MSRFDRAVWLTMGALCLLSILLIAGNRPPSARVVYISWNDSYSNQLYTIELEADTPTRLTNEPFGVVDFALAPTGQTVAYTVKRENNTTDLYAIQVNGKGRRLLLDCAGNTLCSHPVWHPDGRRLVYERRAFLSPQSPAGPSRLWWLNTETGATSPVFNDSQFLGSNARFSPDGQWLSYVAPLDRVMQATHLLTGQDVSVPSQTGEAGAWSPNAGNLLFTDINLDNNQFSIHILRLNMATEEVVDLSGELFTTDGYPDWSPDGQWIAFTRKHPRQVMGKQVWRMTPDGADASPLTNDDNATYTNLHWLPDSQRLLVQRTPITGEEDAGIFLIHVETGEMEAVTNRGIMPAWYTP